MTDTHGGEDVTTGMKVTGKGAGRHIGKFCQHAFTDEKMLVVEINHVD